MILSKWNDNLKEIFNGVPQNEKLEIVISSILDFMISKNWRGACHESCGVLYVLLNELGISCEWRLGEVRFKDKAINKTPICFDHSWILLDGQIIDLAICRTAAHEYDVPPTIMSKNIENLGEPAVIYDFNSGWGDDPNTKLLKNTPLSMYFNNSPMHKTLGTWLLIQNIANKVSHSTSIVSLRKKYSGIYWK